MKQRRGCHKAHRDGALTYVYFAFSEGSTRSAVHLTRLAHRDVGSASLDSQADCVFAVELGIVATGPLASTRRHAFVCRWAWQIDLVQAANYLVRVGAGINFASSLTNASDNGIARNSSRWLYADSW